MDARRVRGRDLVAELLKHRRRDGSFERQSNWTAFGVARPARGRSLLAVVRRARAPPAGSPASRTTTAAFSFATRGGGSFVDETGAALQGLAAAGRAASASVTRALAYLRKAQNTDGGFGQSEGYRSNAQSTAWAIEGIVAAGKNPSASGRRGARRSRSSRSLRACRRQLPLLALERPDARLGDGRGDRRGPPEGAPAAPGAAAGEAGACARRAGAETRARARGSEEWNALHRRPGETRPPGPRRRAPIATRAVPHRAASRPARAARSPAPAVGLGAVALLATAAGILFRRRHV